VHTAVCARACVRACSRSVPTDRGMWVTGRLTRLCPVCSARATPRRAARVPPSRRQMPGADRPSAAWGCGARCGPRALSAVAVLLACGCAAVEQQHLGQAAALRARARPARAPPSALRVRGGCASGPEKETGEEGEEGGEGWSEDSEVMAVAGEVQTALNRLASYQARTQTVVRNMAVDMMETRSMVQARLARLEPGRDDARRELQAVAAYLDGQIKLVQGSGIVDAPYADLIGSGIVDQGSPASPPNQHEGTVPDHT